jgi:threonine dehydrogenase-like Zn-dependent dehydrogenase
MIGLVFDPRPARLAVAGALSRLNPLWALSAPGPLGLRRLPDPAPPGPDWVPLEPTFAGVCGSDVTEATLQADWDNPLSGLVSFPHVMGHEIVSRVTDPAGTDLSVGETVVVNPWLGCAARGLPSCPACAEGMLPLCAHQGEPLPGVSGSGIHTGNIRGLPGGMGTRMHAHRSQLRRLPDGLEPRAGVLADPLAVGAHAAERVIGGGRLAGPGMGGGRAAKSDLIVVLGAGTIGLAVAASLRRLGAERVVISAAWPYQRALVEGLGAETISHRPLAVVEHVAEAAEGRLSRPWRGLPWLIAGGAAAVVDAVGSTATAALSLAIVRPGGLVVRVGVGRAGRTQATLTYFKEVTVVGSNGYRRDDLGVALAMLAGGDVPWRDWLTHRFPLAGWREAFRIAARPQDHAAVKVTIAIDEKRGERRLRTA